MAFGSKPKPRSAPKKPIAKMKPTVRPAKAGRDYPKPAKPRKIMK